MYSKHKGSAGKSTWVELLGLQGRPRLFFLQTSITSILVVSPQSGCGDETTPKWVIKPPPPHPFLAIWTPEEGAGGCPMWGWYL